MTTLEIPPEGIPGDGIGGTDNVKALFPDRPSAIPLPPQADVVAMAQHLLERALAGRLTGLVIVGFDEHSEGSSGVVGKCPYATTLGILEDCKFQLLAERLAEKVQGR